MNTPTKYTWHNIHLELESVHITDTIIALGAQNHPIAGLFSTLNQLGMCINNDTHELFTRPFVVPKLLAATHSSYYSAPRNI